MHNPNGGGATAMTQRERMTFLESEAEAAYDRMYDAHSPSEATACYSDAKAALFTALGIARELSDAETEKRLEARLAHIKAVFRSQFT
jgi:hypothetical protein